jgi:hypothetical protein
MGLRKGEEFPHSECNQAAEDGHQVPRGYHEALRLKTSTLKLKVKKFELTFCSFFLGDRAV